MTERERALLMGKKVNPLTANESAIAYAVAHGGGSEPSYETVAEIPVGTMELMPDTEATLYGASTPVASVPTDSGLYFGSPDYPLTRNEHNGITNYLYNLDISTGERPDTSKPGYGLLYQPAQDAYVCTVVSSDDLSNTTVKILKKAEEPSVLPEVTAADNGDVLTVVDGAWDKAEPNPNLKPTYEFGFEMTADGQGNFTVTADEGVTFAALKSALAETPLVFAMVRHGGQLSRIQIQSDRESEIETTVIFYAGNNTFLALDISIAADDTITPTAKTLT